MPKKVQALAVAETEEMIGLKWSDIDFKKKVVHIQQSMEYRHSVGEWRIGEPNTI